MTVENVELTDDGGAIVNPIMEEPENEFDQNLAELLSDDDLNMISSDLINDYKEDKSSREEWHDAYSKGLKLLGFNYEDRSQPFQGASGVTHPLLSETVTQFQAQAYKELLPANGPVRTQIIGSSDSQKEEQAQRDGTLRKIRKIWHSVNWSIWWSWNTWNADSNTKSFWYSSI